MLLRYTFSIGLFLKRRYFSIYYCNKCKKVLNIFVKIYFDWKVLISEVFLYILSFRFILLIVLVLVVSFSLRMISIFFRWLSFVLRLLVIFREALSMFGSMFGLVILCLVFIFWLFVNRKLIFIYCYFKDLRKNCL